MNATLRTIDFVHADKQAVIDDDERTEREALAAIIAANQALGGQQEPSRSERPYMNRQQSSVPAAEREFVFYSVWPTPYPAKPAVYSDDNIQMDMQDERTGPELGCLACQSTAPSHLTGSSTYLVYELCCGECLEPLVAIDTLYAGIHIGGRP